MTRSDQASVEALIAGAAAHYEAGNLAQSETAYREALALAPGHARITHNLAVVLAARGMHREAIDYFDRAIAAEPHYVSAHYNRAVALMALGLTPAAIEGFSRACALEPEHYESHRALGFLWLAQGNRGRALDHFARTYELRRGEDRSSVAIKSLTTTMRHKLMHDAEQFRYLSQRLRDGQRFEARARNYEEVAKTIAPEETIMLSEQQIELLGEDYNTAIHVRNAPELGGPTIRVHPDGDAIVREFSEGQGTVCLDDLLTPQALLGLRCYLLESTIWHDFNHIDGFVASYLEDGLACPLLLQIADELRAALPGLFDQHPLSQAWVFKGLQESSAIDVHADDAAISVNLWVTPGHANLDTAHGGLIVCRAPPPADLAPAGYHEDRDRAVTFLGQNADRRLVVAYRENRAAVFQSRLLHYSDSPRFAQGYENHRINVTLLFGGAASPRPGR